MTLSWRACGRVDLAKVSTSIFVPPETSTTSSSGRFQSNVLTSFHAASLPPFDRVAFNILRRPVSLLDILATLFSVSSSATSKGQRISGLMEFDLHSSSAANEQTTQKLAYIATISFNATESWAAIGEKGPHGEFGVPSLGSSDVQPYGPRPRSTAKACIAQRQEMARYKTQTVVLALH